jgi:hypothetical protein
MLVNRAKTFAMLREGRHSGHINQPQQPARKTTMKAKLTNSQTVSKVSDAIFSRLARSGDDFPLGSILAKHANAISKGHGYGSATTIILSDEDKLVEGTHSCWRKKTTGEPVPQAYVNKAWSSCYYSRSTVVVAVNSHALLLA